MSGQTDAGYALNTILLETWNVRPGGAVMLNLLGQNNDY